MADANAKIKIEIPFEKKFDWKDISHEKVRKYAWVFDKGVFDLVIENPLKLFVSESGGHRIFNGERCYYVAPGWSYIEWEPVEGMTTEEAYQH